jgi:hypothetical protein
MPSQYIHTKMWEYKQVKVAIAQQCAWYNHCNNVSNRTYEPDFVSGPSLLWNDSAADRTRLLLSAESNVAHICDSAQAMEI